MITVFADLTNKLAPDVITEALRRSATRGMVTVSTSDDTALIVDGGVFVFVSPDHSRYDQIEKALSLNSKILIFGSMPTDLASLCGLSGVGEIPASWLDAAMCQPTRAYEFAESDAVVRWHSHPLATFSPFRSRPFLRFDFANEWNNLGYGRIAADGGPWSISMAVEASQSTVLASAFTSANSEEMPFVTLFETETSSLLWWNRATGGVDSPEWVVVETFLAGWRHEVLPCVPVVSEIPCGFDGVVTMRLDCDEDIASARPLFELYRSRGLPFSVAVKTGQQEGDAHDALLKDIVNAGGAVLSHSVTHAPEWGGSEEACFLEARTSSDWLEERLPGVTIRYAVSPFHQNPSYVPPALRRAGLQGFVGGIIANDPEMLLARGGTIPGDSSGLITHSQQCMLHGDCLLSKGDPLAINKQAFDAARKAKSMFGYLDHPFSLRYEYGWGSEEKRLAMHTDFLNYIGNAGKDQSTLWLNEVDALDWISAKMQLSLRKTERGFEVSEGTAFALERNLEFQVSWRGRNIPLSEIVDGE